MGAELSKAADAAATAKREAKSASVAPNLPAPREPNERSADLHCPQPEFL
jgi:hypothetical protein